jgi:AcrR family transcriptional regulator
MNVRPSFLRARQPDQKAIRRNAILEAAAALFVAEGLDAVSLNEVARKAGIAKSNVYRYFESREAIFLALKNDDMEVCVAEIEERLARLSGKADVHKVARVRTQTIVAAPRFCALESAVTAVFEQNASEELIANHKRTVLRLGTRLGNAMRAALPSLPAAAVGPLLKYLHAAVAGLYPLAFPPPAVARALQDPQLAPLRCDFAEDLESVLVALLNSLCSDKPRR